jgi:hypothetical protein
VQGTVELVVDEGHVTAALRRVGGR